MSDPDILNFLSDLRISLFSLLFFCLSFSANQMLELHLMMKGAFNIWLWSHAAEVGLFSTHLDPMVPPLGSDQTDTYNMTQFSILSALIWETC